MTLVLQPCRRFSSSEPTLNQVSILKGVLMESAVNTQKPVVAHLRTPYLSFSETFIYGFLKNTSRFHPIVLTMRKENEKDFPFGDVHLLRAPRVVRALWERVLCFDSSVLKYAPWYPAHMRAIRRHNVSVLHAHFGTTGYFAWPLKSVHRLPLVTSFYGADVTSVPRQPRWPGRYRRLFASGEQFTVNSKLMKSRLIDLGCPAEKITIVRTGVDLKQFTSHPRQVSERGEPTKFLIVARFVEKKGIEYAIKAFARVHAKHPETELRIIGDGVLRPRIERLISDLAVGDSVDLLGFQPHAIFVEETKRCHVLLQASVTARDGDQEGVPVTMVEAHAAGMPIVASRHSGNPEAMLDGESGFLVPERDVDALAAKMTFLVEHPEIWNEMGCRGRQHIERYYNVRIETRRLENVYERAMIDRARSNRCLSNML